MALNPDEIVSQGTWEPGVEGKSDVPQSIELPGGVQRTNEYYAQYTIYRDGRRVIQWYKRGTGTPGQKDDPVLTTTTNTVPDIKSKWEDDVAKEKAGTRAEEGGVVKEGSTRGPQNGPTREVYRGGQWVTESNPVYQQPATTGRVEGTPTRQADGTTTYDNTKPIWVERDAQGQQIGAAKPLTTEQRQQWEKDTGQQQAASDTKPLEGYPGWNTKTTKVGNDTKTVFINPQGQVADDPRPSANRPGPPTLHPDGKGGSIAIQSMPDGSIKQTPMPNIPSDVARVTVDGVVYEKGPDGKYAPAQGIQSSPYTQTTQDKETGKWYGLKRDGTWEEMKGGPGAPAAGAIPAGPPMPEIILGHSQDALREYGAKLDALVAAGRMTPAERVRRFNEALAVAQHTVNEATLQQREQESNLNASVNLANSRLSASTTGFGQALSFVNNINGWLPKNSSLGGQAFEALLGLQLAQAQRMGAYGNIDPSAQVPLIGRGGEAATRADTAATTAMQPQTAPVAAPAPAPAAPSAPSAASDAAVAASMAGERTTPPAAAAPTPTSPVLPAINPATGEPTGLAPTPGQPGAAPYVRPLAPGEPGVLTVQNSQGRQSLMTQADYDALDPVTKQGYTIVPTAAAPSVPVNPPAGQSGNNPNMLVGQAQGGQDDFAVLRNAPAGVPLAPATPMPTLAQTQIPTPSASGTDMPTAILHSQAAMTPPWQLSEAQMQQMRAAGVPDSIIWSVPGRAA